MKNRSVAILLLLLLVTAVTYVFRNAIALAADSLTTKQANSLFQTGATAVSTDYGQLLVGYDSTNGVYRRVTVDASGNIAAAGASTPSDAFANPTTAALSESFAMYFNGTTWDRSRNDASKNLLVSLGTGLNGTDDTVSIQVGAVTPGITSSGAVGTEQGIVVRNVPIAANLVQTGTAAAGTGVTITLPSVASQFHYIDSIKVQQYATAATTGGATPVICTTTNIPNTPTMNFPTAQAIGTINTVELWGTHSLPVKSTTVATATTVVCPATTSVIWVVTATYYAAP